MSYAPIAPFRRALDRATLAHDARCAGGPERADKWEALRLLGRARGAFGLSHQALAVLQALVSFHPETELRRGAPAVVHPANATICDRLAGMPCSTMRRHVARLVDAGVILRRDSPNGKRYARRVAGGKVAYGFDLSPLRARIEEFRDAAEKAEDAALRLKQARDCVKLMLRDLHGVLALSLGSTDPRRDALEDRARLTARDLRRSLTLDNLAALRADLAEALSIGQALIPVDTHCEADKMSTRDAGIEHHQQRINKESIDGSEREDNTAATQCSDSEPSEPCREKPVSLARLLGTCPDVKDFAPEPIFDWPSMLRACDAIRPMLGLDERLWQSARQILGGDGAAMVLAVILQRFSTIRNPGGYLRHLVDQAKRGEFRVSILLRTVVATPDPARCSQL